MRALKVGAALIVGAAMWMVANAPEVRGDSASPSVRQAARLKYNPPPNWIRHYLGDDRYKIEGGTWKVVSTETDTHYYPAWAPEMLRQSNGIVIGFPSAAAAEEAGYKRSNYPMESPLLGLTGRPQPTPVPAPVAASAPSMGPASAMGGFTIPTGVTPNLNKGKARRILLVDGVSSTVLPSGWSHLSRIERAPQNAQGRGPQEEMLDFFFPGVPDPNIMSDASKVPFIVIGSVVLPGGMNAEEMFSARKMRQQMAALNRAMQSSGRVDTRMPDLTQGISAFTFGNVSGIKITAPVREIGRSVPIGIGGKGSKAFFVISTAGRARNGGLIINGLRGR